MDTGNSLILLKEGKAISFFEVVWTSGECIMDKWRNAVWTSREMLYGQVEKCCMLTMS